MRLSWHMEIVLEVHRREPKLPEGIELRPFVKGEHESPSCRRRTKPVVITGAVHDCDS